MDNQTMDPFLVSYVTISGKKISKFFIWQNSIYFTPFEPYLPDRTTMLIYPTSIIIICINKNAANITSSALFLVKRAVNLCLYVYICLQISYQLWIFLFAARGEL